MKLIINLDAIDAVMYLSNISDINSSDIYSLDELIKERNFYINQIVILKR